MRPRLQPLELHLILHEHQPGFDSRVSQLQMEKRRGSDTGTDDTDHAGVQEKERRMPKAKAFADQALCRKTINSSRRITHRVLSSLHRQVGVNHRNQLITEPAFADREWPEIGCLIYLTVIPSQQALEILVAKKTYSMGGENFFFERGFLI
jgi:hypothetical protein